MIVWSGVSRQIIVILLLILLWGIIVLFGIVPVGLLPKPIDVFVNIYDNIIVYLSRLIYTMGAAMFGLLGALIISLILSVLGSLYRPILNALLSFSVLSQTTPVIAIAPIITYICGFTVWTQSIVALLVSLFPVGDACARAIAYCPKEFQNIAKTINLSRHGKLKWIDIPRITEAVFASLPLSSVLAYIGALVYEFIQPDRGIGAVIVMSQRSYDEVPLFGCVLLVIFTGLVVYGLFQCIYIIYRVYRRDLVDKIT